MRLNAQGVIHGTTETTTVYGGIQGGRSASLPARRPVDREELSALRKRVKRRSAASATGVKNARSSAH